MDKVEFLTQFQDVLQRDEELTMETVLSDLEEWDSLSKMATVAFLDAKFGLKTTFADFKEIKTVGDIANKAGL